MSGKPRLHRVFGAEALERTAKRQEMIDIGQAY